MEEVQPTSSECLLFATSSVAGVRTASHGRETLIGVWMSQTGTFARIATEFTVTIIH